MDNFFKVPISVEKFAAYLDKNLPESEMNYIEMMITENPALKELVNVSGVIDEDIQTYLQDEFAYDADMTILDSNDFDIPNLDTEFILPDVAAIHGPNELSAICEQAQFHYSNDEYSDYKSTPTENNVSEYHNENQDHMNEVHPDEIPNTDIFNPEL